MSEAPQPVVRMDKSRDFSTVHGERPSGDRHAKVFFYQDGLPFTAAGILIHDHPDIDDDQTGKLRKRVEHLQQQAVKRASDAPGDDAAENIDVDEDGDPVDVNLTEWAAGAKYPWQSVSNAIARRFHKRVSNKRDALETLIEEHVVSVGQLSEPFKKLLRD